MFTSSRNFGTQKNNPQDLSCWSYQILLLNNVSMYDDIIIERKEWPESNCPSWSVEQWLSKRNSCDEDIKNCVWTSVLGNETSALYWPFFRSLGSNYFNSLEVLRSSIPSDHGRRRRRGMNYGITTTIESLWIRGTQNPWISL